MADNLTIHSPYSHSDKAKPILAKGVQPIAVAVYLVITATATGIPGYFHFNKPQPVAVFTDGRLSG
jgi:hypothetical protein